MQFRALWCQSTVSNCPNPRFPPHTASWLWEHTPFPILICLLSLPRRNRGWGWGSHTGWDSTERSGCQMVSQLLGVGGPPLLAGCQPGRACAEKKAQETYINIDHLTVIKVADF